MTMLSYTASSLEDIAEVFSVLALREKNNARFATTRVQERYNEGAAYAYEDAANIIRNTTLKGN